MSGVLFWTGVCVFICPLFSPYSFLCFHLSLILLRVLYFSLGSEASLYGGEPLDENNTNNKRNFGKSKSWGTSLNSAVSIANIIFAFLPCALHILCIFLKLACLFWYVFILLCWHTFFELHLSFQPPCNNLHLLFQSYNYRRMMPRSLASQVEQLASPTILK